MKPLALLLVVAATAACSGGEDASTVEPAAGTNDSSAEANETPAEPIDVGTTVGDEIPPTTTASTTTEPTTIAPATTIPTTTAPPTTFPSAAVGLGLATIEQLTETTGVGTRPVLRWAPVEGARRYHLFVLSPSDVVYWGWQTTDTSVPVGGLPALPEGAPGPAISEGMTWSVAAVDDDGHIIALSARRPISP